MYGNTCWTQDVRSVRARSARILITSLKYYECHRITHSYHYTLKNYDLYYFLMSSNVTKYLTRASRSNTGTTWTKLLITLFIVALIMSIGDAALQLGCFVALPWLCVIFLSVIYFDSKHVHESLVPRVLKIVGDDENVDDVKIPRCPHCGLRVKHDDESQCPKQDKVCWLLRAEEPYLMNEKKHITEISNFAPNANGYFGLSGLDVLRYLLLVVCLNVSSGICVVWWWVRIEISLSLSS